MPKLFSILFLFFLVGCYSPKKAEKQINKAQLNFPEVLAKKSKELYPCKPQKGGSDSSRYKTIIKKIKQIDTAYFYTTDTVCRLDTVLIEKNCTKVLYKYREILKELPAVHDTINITDESAVTSLTYQLQNSVAIADKYKQKYTKSLWFSIWLLIAIAGLILVIKFKK
jgi:hypothetical protein